MKNELVYIYNDDNYIINISNKLMIEDFENKVLDLDNISENIKNDYLLKAQKYIIDKENKFLFNLNILDFLYGNSDFLCKVSNVKNTINQKHISVLYLDSEKDKKFMNDYKKNYMISKREIKNIDDNKELIIDDMLNDNSLLKKIFSARFYNLRRRCDRYDYPIPNKEKIYEMFYDILLKNKIKDFRCHYCNNVLRFVGNKQIKNIIDNKDLFTFEHKIPLSRGGTHNKDNLVFSCLSCNTLKEDMTEELFLKFLNKLDKETKDELFIFKKLKDVRINNVFKKKDKSILSYINEIKELKGANTSLRNYNKNLLDKIK